MGTQGFIVIGFCVVGCWSAWHVGHRMPDQRKPRRWSRSRPLPSRTPRTFSMRRSASTPTRSAYSPTHGGELGSFAGTTGTTSPVVEAFNSCTPPGLPLVGWEIPRTLRDLNNSGGPTSYGYAMGARGTSGVLIRFAESRSPVAELWGDFDWEDAAA